MSFAGEIIYQGTLAQKHAQCMARFTAISVEITRLSKKKKQEKILPKKKKKKKIRNKKKEKE